MREVTAYVAHWCAPSNMAANLLKKAGIVTHTINIEHNPIEAREANIKAVPTFLIGDDRIIGFDKSTLKLIKELVNAE